MWTMVFKDWASLLLSITALAISAATAYFNFLQIDDLKVLVQGYSKFELDRKSQRLTPRPNYSLTLINSGTRAASITYVGIAIQQFAGVDNATSCSTVQNWSTTGLGPLVVKPNDISILEIAPDNSALWLENESKWSGDKMTVLICFMFIAIAPDRRRANVAVEASRITMNLTSGFPILPAVSVDPDRKPQPILSSRRLRFIGTDSP
jgi:hypothetical protein